MAAFSQQFHHPFPLDSPFSFPNSSSIINEVTASNLEDPNIGNLISNYFSHFNPPGGNNNLDHEQLTSGQISTDSSTVLDRQLEAGEQVCQKLNSIEKKRKKSNNSAQSKDKRESKSEKQKKGQIEMGGEGQKLEAEGAEKKGERKVPDEEASKGYIYVRAWRGQATDSHSLAERVRREKISERMRTLQGLVPGCDKVTGKALMLDEIINYVQSLQNQVEFLSMKLASVNPIFHDSGMDVFMVRQEVLNSLESRLQQYSSPNQSTALPDATIRTTLPSPSPDNFPFLDPSAASFLFQQGQRFVNTSGLANNLCSDLH